MIFEGSEKKAEIIVNGEINLLERSDAFWAQLVERANATILSSISNTKVKAYLLSESSLFVWEDRILLITCGQTTLINAIKFFVDELGQDNIAQVIFQRKNEYFSHMQPTTFYDDIKVLEEKFDGVALRMGNMDDHHNFIYHLDKVYSPNPSDHTFEFLMYEISEQARSFLMREDLTSDEIRNFLKLDIILPGFEIDDFVFQPYGYSLNAIKDDCYLTIHITPQEVSPYVSFETDTDIRVHIATLLEVFNPVSYDFIEFEPGHDKNCGKEIPPSYQLKSHVEANLTCGYKMYFSHFYKERKDKLTPFKIL